MCIRDRSNPKIDPTLVDNLELQLSYSTSLDGDVTISSEVGAGGYFEFTVPIQDNEPLGIITATLDFFGWHQDDLNNLSSPLYHANPKSIALPLNITPNTVNICKCFLI